MTVTRRLQIVVDLKDNVKGGLSGILSSFGGIGGAAKLAAGGIGLLGGAAAAAGGFLISLGSDAEEMESKFNVVFGDGAPEAAAALDEFGNAVGRNKFDLMSWAATLQDIFVPLGFARDEASDMSVQLTKLAVDLGSFNNVAEADVMADLQTAIVGNTEVMRKYGVVISQATIEQEALRLGLIQNKSELDAQAKAQAILSLIVQGTTDAQGDAARTAGGWANQMRALKAELSEAATAMGQKLLPVVTPLLKDFITWIKDVMPRAVLIFAEWSDELKATAGPAMLMIQDALTRIAQAFGVQTDKVTASDVALRLFKAVLDALIIAIKLFAIGMQGAAWAVEKVSEAIRIAKSLADQLGTIIKLAMDRARNGLNSAIAKWNEFKRAVRSAVDAIPTWLIPHSPTPFEIGLRGIANAAGSVAGQLPQAFNVRGGGGPALAGVGGGGGPVVIQFTYAPTFSLADRMEAEQVLAPMIGEGVRNYLAGRR